MRYVQSIVIAGCC